MFWSVNPGINLFLQNWLVTQPCSLGSWPNLVPWARDPTLFLQKPSRTPSFHLLYCATIYLLFLSSLHVLWGPWGWRTRVLYVFSYCSDSPTPDTRPLLLTYSKWTLHQYSFHLFILHTKQGSWMMIYSFTTLTLTPSTSTLNTCPQSFSFSYINSSPESTSSALKFRQSSKFVLFILLRKFPVHKVFITSVGSKRGGRWWPGAAWGRVLPGGCRPSRLSIFLLH